ncbi:type II toxin-antitoxin system PemK/MazF family toxin [Microbacterium sp. cx-55]|uniref:type II toxin-antitoxin system PemK/MazF family toxin n=1 Tax=Microbacterium sp. cx-55 TaxID=2875948 RepID=UPI001CBDD586|nr:type II toxin-antitoxin system PemK/MazF family toxin [Microbacterium sp. cx-55]MBZ4486350.1 type II toxin-antitoxin system PemK/MazF family toxin [Microbacterium sp. cx-55]UGB33811.1 type II toxin-antitoxin system PemK/MazF family toxin [Microbacterium sp. cx-55]
MSTVGRFLSRVARVFGRPRTAHTPASDSGATVEIDPTRVSPLTLAYAPRRDARADAGEIVWTWVPYAERDGRGKDRPVLVIAGESDDRVYAVKLTSRSHDGDREYVPIGAGDWDAQGRPSWVDVDQLYSVHQRGLRRQGAPLDARRFAGVAEVLARRYGWKRR